MLLNLNRLICSISTDWLSQMNYYFISFISSIPPAETEVGCCSFYAERESLWVAIRTSLPGGSSLIVVEFHLKCPQGFHSLPPRVAPSQNSQRPGIAIRRTNERGA